MIQPGMFHRFVMLLIASSLLAACSGGGGDSGDALIRSYDDVHSYRNASPFATVLRDCVNASDSADSCTLATLPPLGMNGTMPTLEQVMERVLVSHDWMGANFERMLRDELPSDLLSLLKPITAIVIDSEIRPSYYWAVTGAIHLDPAYLWLSNAEKADVDQDDDYRSDYGQDLQFEIFYRYLKGGAYAWDYYALDGSSEREPADIRYNLARTLYHELAHANDFLPPSYLSQPGMLDPAQSFWAAVSNASGDRLSTRLRATHPLQNDMLLALAQVRFRTGEADDEQASYSAATVGDAFAGEGSEHFYGYYTQYEDLAMLFEAAQLKRHFDIDAEVASVIKPDGAGSCTEADWLIAWGERRRLASPLTAPRARTAASLLLPDVDWPGLFATINASSPSPDANWCSLRPAYRSLSAFDAIDWQRANRTDPRHLPPLPSQP